VFHVEHAFLLHWRTYRRALRQRNAALRSGGDLLQIGSWDQGLAEAGEGMTAARQGFVALLATEFASMQSSLSPSMPGVELSLVIGWPEDRSLAEALCAGVERDLTLGHTRQGPHRADLRISSGGLVVAGRLSRGQQKLVALALTLALLKVLDGQAGIRPVFCFDDFASELDQTHQAMVLETVCELGCQVLLTGNQEPALPRALSVAKKMFHVEQGKVLEVL
jgi:DNA replication and repair protein RecF